MDTNGLGHSREGRINALTGIRFFAALAVVVFHSADLVPYPHYLRPFIAAGPAAVGLFFLLSGFILYYNYHGWFAENVSAGRYWRYVRARFARVYPMHLTALLLATIPMLYCIVFQPGLAHTELGNVPSWRSVGLSWIANLLLIQTWLRFWKLANLWNPPAWSLGCEFFFYALLPFFVALVLRRVRSTNAIIQLVGVLYGVEIALLAALALVIPHLPATPIGSLPGFNSQNMLWFLGVFSPLFRVWEFFIGGALGALYLRLQCPGESHVLHRCLQNEGARNILVGGSCLAALAVVAIPNGTGSWQGQAWTLMRYHPAFTPFFGILILTLASGRNFLSDLLEHPWILKLGEASYSLYITHYILFQVLAQAHATGRPIPVALPLLLIPGSVALSLCFWKWVETPLRKFINPRRSLAGTA